MFAVRLNLCTDARRSQTMTIVRFVTLLQVNRQTGGRLLIANGDTVCISRRAIARPHRRFVSKVLFLCYFFSSFRIRPSPM
jgi:hypothetical protein